MAKQFGKTWWGQQWLNSLANIDFGNRLPRGATYARKGSVADISIDGNVIKAKVKGSRPRPYDITIAIPPFTEAGMAKLIKSVAAKPVVISKLLNRELDPEILNIADECGLKVFPRQWTDFKMQCNCPDFAVPCKHLAAVIYKVSEEIDNNPFLVFQLHGMDLTTALQEENIHVQSEGISIPLLSDLLKAQPAAPKTKKGPSISKEMKGSMKKIESFGNEGASDDDAAAPSFDFSTLSPLTDALVQFLGDDPAFYTGSGNFRDKYAFALQKAVKNAGRVLAGRTAMDDYAYVDDFRRVVPVKKKANAAIIPTSEIDHHSNIHLSLTPDNEVTVWIDEKKTGISMSSLIRMLWQIQPAHLQDYQPSVAALRNVLLSGINLVANGAVVPQIARLDKKGYIIRWLPAQLSREVSALTEKLGASLPPGLLRMGGQPLTLDVAVNLLAVFLDHLLQAFAESTDGDIFLDIFFNGLRYGFTDPGQAALPGGIGAWLQRYYLTEGRYKPAIVVDELNDEKFRVTINMVEKDKPLEKPVALQQVLTLKKFDKIRFPILRSLAQLSSFIPGLDDYINSKGKQMIVMDTATFAPFLMQAIPAIQLLNMNILLPKSLQHILRPRTTVRISKKEQSSTGFMRLDKLLDFDWQVAIGDVVMGEEEFKKLLKSSEGLIKFKTKYIYVSSADLEKLQKHFTSSRQPSSLELLRTALGEEYDGAKIALTSEVEALIRALTTQKDIPLPVNLHAQLRPYQQRGFAWLYRNKQIGFGSVLADDMGLGKTLQVITALLKYKEEGMLEKEKALVVAPTGLLTNWLAEFEKFAPSLKCRLHHGTGRKLDKKDVYDVLITSYGIVRSETAILKKMKWHVLVIDEAQNIKNQETAQSKAIKSIPASNFIAMSGTPVENRLSELWSIMDFCNRGFLGALSEFKQSFANPIQNRNDQEAADKLKAVTAPFLMRRLKSDKTIISDLPDKIEMDCFCQLTKAQTGLYQKTLHKALEAIEEVKATDQKSLFVRQGLVLQMILALKQVCNHPTQFLKNNVLDAMLSGKMQLLFDKLESIVEANEKVLIFTQFTEMGGLLKHFIMERFGDAPLFYHGGCSVKQRGEMVNTFQTNRADKVFILSLKAAGTGLNLTAANHVIHYDLWWNPAVEAQATDRAYRIGQKSNVMVHRFITKDTFEERINEMIQRKKQLANMTVATGENWIGNLSNTELRDLFELG
jgi:uncharacterized Zn finger protein